MTYAAFHEHDKKKKRSVKCRCTGSFKLSSNMSLKAAPRCFSQTSFRIQPLTRAWSRKHSARITEMFVQVSLPTSFNNCSKKAGTSKQVEPVWQNFQKTVIWPLLSHEEVLPWRDGWRVLFCFSFNAYSIPQPVFINVLVLLQVQHDQPKSQVTYHTTVW